VTSFSLLDQHLSSRTTITGTDLSIADVSVYARLRDVVERWVVGKHGEFAHVLRWWLHVQHIVLKVDSVLQLQSQELKWQPIEIDITAWTKGIHDGANSQSVSKEAKEVKKVKEVKQAKEAKEKKAKVPAAAAAPTAPPTIMNLAAMFDLRVGLITSVERHPDADSLYVEHINVGEDSDRIVISGLVKYMEMSNMLNQHVVLLCNLKPVTMRGIKSFAMVLCATSPDTEPQSVTRFVRPPAGAVPGQRVLFDGTTALAAYEQLNPKKKIWETVQPKLATDDAGLAGVFDDEGVFQRMLVDGQECRCPEVAKGSIK